MSPFKSQITVWGLSHGTLELEVIWGTCLYLTAPNIDATSLISFFKSYFSKFVISSSIFTFKIVFFIFTILIETIWIIVNFGISLSLRFSGGLSVHEVFPLEDCFVLASGRDNIFLTLSILGKADIGDML